MRPAVLILRRVLDCAGRRGPWVLLGGVGIGVAAPGLAQTAYPLMGVAVFLFTFGAFLKVDLAALKAELDAPARVACALLWSTLGVPFAALLLVRSGAIADPDLCQGLLLAMLAPPVGSAAAIAAMLGLRAPLALLATITATAVCPLTMPALAAVLIDARFDLDSGAMMLRLLLIVGSAWLASLLVRRYAGGFVRANPHCLTGVAVVGLLVVALAAMRGMQAVLLSEPGRVAAVLGLAFAVNAGFQALGALLFHAEAPRSWALTVGLVSGNRNVTLVWAAAAPFAAAHPGIELYLAMSVFPIFVMPALSAGLIRRWTGQALSAPPVAVTPEARRT